jgi:hypothetical protein
MSDTIKDEVEALGRALTAARAEVADGNLVDLTEFGARLQGVCRRIGAAEGDEGQQHIDGLLALREELVLLAQGIQGILADMAEAAEAGAALPETPPAAGR